MMRLGLLCIVVGITGVFASARADILTIRQDVVVPGSTDHVEVTTFLTETEDDRREVVARLRKSLADDVAKNPQLVTGFEQIVDQVGRAPNAVSPADEAIEAVANGREVLHRPLPADVRSALKLKYPEWFVAHSRVIFSVSRGVVNASVSTWGLTVAQHLPFPVAVAAGVLTGGISGGFQFFNEGLQKYLTRSIVERVVKNRPLKKGLKFIESTFRWYLLEVGFVTSVQIALTAMGHAPDTSVLHMIGTNLTTARAAVAGQGLWDIAVSKVTQKNMTLAKTALAKRAVRFRADFITLGLSAFAVTGMIAKVSGLSLGDTIFWGMGVTGAAYMAKVIYDEWRCQKLMREWRPPGPADPLSAPPAGAESLSSDFGSGSAS